MISKAKLKKIIEDAEKKGHKLKVRDVAYAYLCTHFEDSTIAYKVVYGEDVLDTAAFDAKPHIAYIKDQIKYSVITDASESADKMSFDENKKEMIKLIKKTQDAMDDGLMEAKDGLKIIADIRVKLNDKFKVEKQQKERQIIVEKRFDFVCPHTRRECYQLDKEEAMKRWNLTENKQNE